MPLPSLKTSHLFPSLLRIKAIACVIAHKALWYQPLTPFTSSGQISATLSFTHSAWAAPHSRSLYWLFLPPGTPFPNIHMITPSPPLGPCTNATLSMSLSLISPI